MAEQFELIFSDWHAHIYFDSYEAEAVRSLGEAICGALNVKMGRLHELPVGPHLRGSCQITVPREIIGDALEWLLKHRGHFTVFVHGNSGNDLLDHTAHVMWLGDSEPLNLTIFN